MVYIWIRSTLNLTNKIFSIMFNANAKEKHKQKDSRIFCQLRKHTTHTDRTQNTHTHTFRDENCRCSEWQSFLLYLMKFNIYIYIIRWIERSLDIPLTRRRSATKFILKVHWMDFSWSSAMYDCILECNESNRFG